jgi:hypothetical protein
MEKRVWGKQLGHETIFPQKETILLRILIRPKKNGQKKRIVKSRNE